MKRASPVKVADEWLRKILRVLYQRRSLTRAEILDTTGLNPASLSHALRWLLDRGVLLKLGDLQADTGRRREVFGLSSEAGYFVALDLEGDRVRFALTNYVGDVRYRWEEILPLGQPLAPDKLVEGVRRVLRDLDRDQLSRVLAIGISYPGLLDDSGRLTAVNLGWKDFPLAEVLRAAFPWPLFLEQDKHTCVLAESWLGGAQQSNNALFLIYEGGIGLGIIIDRTPLEGSRAFSGEIGHWKILPEAADPCNCGGRGCLEAIASSANIVRQYLEATGRTGAEVSSLRLPEVCEKARQQDPAAQAVLHRAGQALGRALSYAVGLLNPEILILGGDLISAEDVLVPIIRDEIMRLTLPRLTAGLQITVSRLGLDIRLRGAASVAFRNMLHHPALLHNLCAPALTNSRTEVPIPG